MFYLLSIQLFLNVQQLPSARLCSMTMPQEKIAKRCQGDKFFLLARKVLPPPNLVVGLTDIFYYFFNSLRMRMHKQFKHSLAMIILRKALIVQKITHARDQRCKQWGGYQFRNAYAKFLDSHRHITVITYTALNGTSAMNSREECT